MKRHLLLMVVAGVAAAPTASYAADTFTVSVTPTTAGTTAAPAAEEIKTDLRIETDVTGTPHDAVTTYASLMPAEFADNTGAFATCDRKKVHAAATGGPHDPPDCPAASILGGGVIESVVPDLKISSTTDKLIIYNSGGAQLTGWLHVSRPVTITASFDGAVSQGSSPFGPVVTWDFSPAANGEIGGVKVYVKRFQTTWSPRSASGGGGTTATTTGSSNARRRAACIKKATRRYRHQRRKRAKAIRKCRKRYPRSKDRAAAHDRADSGPQISAFQSTGCANGKWPFEAQVKFKDGDPDDKLDQDVACGAAGGTTGGGGAGGGPGGIPCVPVICPAQLLAETAAARWR